VRVNNLHYKLYVLIRLNDKSFQKFSK